MEKFIGEFIVAYSFKNVEENFSCTFVGVYGPSVDSARCHFWDGLVGLYSWWDVLQCFHRDFNVMCFPFERFDEGRLHPAMQDFFKFIFNLNLVDLPLMGGIHTRSNSHSWFKLDCFLISSEWESHFLDICGLPLHLCSNHFLIVFDCDGIQRGIGTLSLRTCD